MAEIVEFLVQSAPPQEAVVDQTMAESAQPLPQRLVTFQKFSHPAVDCSGTRITFHNDSYFDSPRRGLQQGMSQAFISKVVGNPEDFTPAWNRMNSLFQNVTQATRGTIRTTPEYLGWRFWRLIMQVFLGDGQGTYPAE
jgi:hypothetical protein